MTDTNKRRLIPYFGAFCTGILVASTLAVAASTYAQNGGWQVSADKHSATIRPGYRDKPLDITDVTVTMNKHILLSCGIVNRVKSWEKGRCSWRQRDENGKAIPGLPVFALEWTTTHNEHQPPLNPDGGDDE